MSTTTELLRAQALQHAATNPDPEMRARHLAFLAETTRANLQGYLKIAMMSEREFARLQMTDEEREADELAEAREIAERAQMRLMEN